MISSARTTRLAGLAGQRSGNGTHRPPLVLLHGLTFDRTTWEPVLDELAQLDPERSVLALDLPGHGESDSRDSYSLDEVAEQVRAAVVESALATPVVVGHSISGVIATIYASTYPTSGVVNVDASLQVEPMADLAKSLSEAIQGPGFDAVWQRLWESMDTELLPASSQALLRSTCPPRQELFVGYWRTLLDRPTAEVTAWATAVLAIIREAGTPYRVVAGAELETDYRRWLANALPQAEVVVIPGSGHFPQLGDPRRFAELLAAA